MLALQSTFLFAMAGAVAWLLRGRSAAHRHLVWLLSFAVALALPFVPALTPRWSPPATMWTAQTMRTVVNVTAVAETRQQPVRPWAFWIWAAGILLLALRFARANWLAYRLVQRAEAFQQGVAISHEIPIPMVSGFRAPVILLPAGARNWPAGQLASVLAHERMHIARHDLWWQALGHLACCFYWPQPLAWLAASALRKECEQACDDGVLVGGVPASDYAGHLVSIGRTASQTHAQTGGIAMTRTSHLQHRVQAILDPHLARTAAGWRFAASTIFGAFLLTVTLAAMQLPAWAQGGRLSGVVRDASGGVIPRARIDIRGTGDFHEVIYSNPAGEFSLDGLDAGGYDITVSQPGFARLAITGMRFDAQQAKPLDLTLNIGMIHERTQVQADAPRSANPPASGGAAPRRVRVGGNVQSAKLEYQAPVLYPGSAKADHVEGTVLLRAVIGPSGSIVHLEPINRMVDQRLTQAATDGVKQWRYSPTLLNGLPVEVITEVEVNFTLAR